MPASFDTESYSYREADGTKKACMYVWMMGINNSLIYGRTWEEYESLMAALNEKARELDAYITVWVHNLAHDFQFTRHHNSSYNRMFALDKRKPALVETDRIIWRCSFIESGFSLAKITEDMGDASVGKRVGDLDYRLPRGPWTPLTEREWGYCFMDILTLNRYIQKKIDENGDVTLIPNTKTGYVRRDMKEHTVGADKNYWYIVQKIKVTPHEYLQLKKAFGGGFTHASPFGVRTTHKNVQSFDLTSSYPTVMLTETYPMSSGRYIEKIESKEELNDILRDRHCVMTVKFKNLEANYHWDYPISEYHCEIKGHREVYNGRVASADELIITMTDVDWSVYLKWYSFSSIQVRDVYVYEPGYLPKLFVERMLYYYNAKTAYKDVAGKEQEYNSSKASLNSFFGMCVMDIVRAEIEFENGYWGDEIEEEPHENDYDEGNPFNLEAWDDPILAKKIDRYNKNRGRFICWQWGIFVTSYARRNLFMGLLEVGKDYIYADTDSLKFKNPEEHLEWFERYNANIAKKCDKALQHHGLDIELSRPKNPKGKVCQLGVWDDDGSYEYFRTLGAKRYAMIVKKGDKHYIKTTVAGVNKAGLPKFLANNSSGEVTCSPEWLDKFDDHLVIPAEYSGKLTHTYIDHEITCEFTDIYGIHGTTTELSAAHLEPTAYNMDISAAMIDYLFTFSSNYRISQK